MRKGTQNLKKKKILTFTILTFHHLYQKLEGQSLLPKYKCDDFSRIKVLIVMDVNIF